MDSLSIIGLFGSAASLWSAWFAWKKSRESRNAADKAEKAVSRLEQNRDIGEMGQVKGSCEAAVRTMSKYGPGCVESALVGVSYGGDATVVQEFLATAMNHQGHFTRPFKKLKDTVEPLLRKLSEAAAPEDAKEPGGLIYDALGEFGKIVDNNMRKAQKAYE